MKKVISLILAVSILFTAVVFSSISANARGWSSNYKKINLNEKISGAMSLSDYCDIVYYDCYRFTVTAKSTVTVNLECPGYYDLDARIFNVNKTELYEDELWYDWVKYDSADGTYKIKNQKIDLPKGDYYFLVNTGNDFGVNFTTYASYNFKLSQAITVGKVSGLKCKARTDSSITVTWNKMSGVSGYQIQTCTKDGKKWSTCATLGSGTNTYTFKKLASGNNYKFRCRAFIKDSSGNTTYGSWCGTLNKPTLPKSISLSKLTAAKKAFTAQWKKQSGVTGYQIQYSTSSKFTNAKYVTVKNVKTLKATAKNLSAKKTYYVRVRTYKTINKSNHCSVWSKTYKVKTK